MLRSRALCTKGKINNPTIELNRAITPKALDGIALRIA